MGILDMFGLSSSSANALAKKAQKAQLAGIGQGVSATKQGTKKALGAVQTGATAATGALAPAITAAGNYLGTQNQGYGTYMDALGLNGPEGAARAQAAYSASLQPGTNLAEQSILRNNAAAGGLRAGGTSTDLANYLFNTQYDPWRSSLQGFNPLSAIQEQGALGQAQGNIYTGLGAQQSGLYTGQAGALAGLYGQQGQANANLYNQQAANNAAVAGNWGSLAGGLLGAGTKLFGMYGPTPNLGSMGSRSLFG